VKVTETGVNNGQPVTTQDMVRIRVCPFLPVPQTQRIETLIQPRRLGSTDPFAVWNRFREDILRATPVLEPLDGKIDTISPVSAFPQDQAEFGYAYLPNTGEKVRIALGFNRLKGAQPSLLGKFVGSNRGAWSDERWKSGGQGDRGAMGGNLEVSPAFDGYPFGITVIADTEVNSRKLFTKFIALQSVQEGSLIVADFSGMPLVAHIDEVISFVPAGSDFAVLIVDLDKTMNIFASNPNVRVSATETYANILEKFRPGGVDGEELARYKTALAALRAHLVTKFGVERVVGFPALPKNSIFNIANAINLLVLPDEDGVHLVVPDRGAPEYRAAVQSALSAASIAIPASRVHFLDTGVLSNAGGEIHCGTNAIRVLPQLQLFAP